MHTHLLVIFGLLTPGAAAVDPFEGAMWLRDRVFQDVSVITIMHKEGASGPEESGPKNVHTYFRKLFDLPSEPVEAWMVITADDYAKVHLNGCFAYQGPESGYPYAYPYHRVDVREHLRAGKNVIAAHAYYQGLRNRVWNSGDNRSGLLMALDIVCSDGTRHRVVTDETWRCFRPQTFQEGHMVGYKTQYMENIDMRLEPKGWRGVEFDDSGWDTPLTGAQDHELAPSITAPLEIGRALPRQIAVKGDGRYFYDFGTEVVGHTRIVISGPAGHVIEVRHGEELDGPETVRYQMRANCNYQEFVTLSGGEDTIEFYDYKAFRYMEVLHAPVEPEVWVMTRSHAFDPEATALRSSETLLERIWAICRDGVRWGSQGGFLDCPTREKGQYLGDALITSRSHLILTADPTLTLKSLWDFKHSQRICPGIMAVAPGSLMQEFAEYSLQWPMMLLNYYQLTGDRYQSTILADQGLEPLFAHFAQFETQDGLLVGVDKQILVDWPTNMRGDYDYGYANSRENAVVNAFYYASLRAAETLTRAFGGDGEAYGRRATRVLEAFQAKLYDADAGLYADAPGSSHHSLHANALPLAFGMVPDEIVPNVVALIREKRLNCGVYIAPFVIEACWRAGENELAYDLLTSKDERSWHEMLKHGATTCMEVWGPEQKRNTSWCHPWSSSPIYLIAQGVLGLEPGEPGWRTLRVTPRVPAGRLERLELTLTLPQGRVSVTHVDGAPLKVEVPVGMRVEIPEEAQGKVELVAYGEPGHGALTVEQAALLAEHGWEARTDGAVAVWVSVAEQRLRIVRGSDVLWDVACSTAKNGVGAQKNSEMTPLGWHVVSGKVGEGEPWGRVFRSRVATGEVWRPGMVVEDDLVLTRILLLDGLEPGVNKGGDVDSAERYIYVHGTNGEALIGTPASHGCIRLRNDDVIEAFRRIGEGTRVLITE